MAIGLWAMNESSPCTKQGTQSHGGAISETSARRLMPAAASPGLIAGFIARIIRCLLCGTAFEYNWTSVHRTGRWQHHRMGEVNEFPRTGPLRTINVNARVFLKPAECSGHESRASRRVI